MLAILGLILLAAGSEHLALNRNFAADELENVFVARLLATGKLADYGRTASVIHQGPMRWIAENLDRSATMLQTTRLLFFPLFWINLMLIVRCAGIPLRSPRGLVALFLAGTLAPLWDFGYEIRPETPLLTVILLAWSFGRALIGKRSLFVVGLCCVIAQFFAPYAFVYTVPIALFALAAEKERIGRALATFAVGVAGGIGIAALLRVDLLTWIAEPQRFSAWPTLGRLIIHTPVLLLLTGYAVVYAFKRDQSLVPEVVFLAIAIIALFVNPAPHRLVLVVPQLAILCLRLAPLVEVRIWRTLLALFVVHVAWWLIATMRHGDKTNARQVELMTTAEDMTDPNADHVLAGTLVPSRWLPLRPISEVRTPVIIRDAGVRYSPADEQFIRQHYIALSDDFLVAGGVVRDHFDCVIPGRYFHTGQRGVVELTRGRHTFDRPGQVIWLGPDLFTPPLLSGEEPTELYVGCR